MKNKGRYNNSKGKYEGKQRKTEQKLNKPNTGEKYTK